jgi:EmrB/QacA subfamily drug resistance transporter
VTSSQALTAPPRGTPPTEPSASSPRRSLLTLIAVALGVMMVALDGTIVAVANPVIQTDLNASLADIQWVTNGYLLSLAVSLITIGKIGDRFGHKKVFLTGVVGFALVSAAIGLSGAIAPMIAFRVLQGVFGAMLQPTALALLRNTFTGRKLNTAIGVWGAIIGASTAAGPIVGGLLVQHVNWQSVFYVNVPVGVIALALGFFVLRETPKEKAGAFDVAGVVLLSASLFALVWGLIKAPANGWGSATTLLFLGGAIVLGALFVLRENRAKDPLLPLRLFRSVSVSSGTVLVMLLMFAMLGALFFITFYLENVFGLGPVAAGLRILPMTGMMIIGSPLSSMISNRIGARIPIVVGMVLAAVALFGLSQVTIADGTWGTLWWFVLLGLGLSPVMVGATDIIVGNAPVELAGVAGGLQSTSMQLGGTLGTAILGAVMASRIGALFPQRWAAAHLPALSGAAQSQAENAVSVGVAPVQHGMPGPIVQVITQITHNTFVDGMHTAFLISAIVAICGAAVGLLAKPGKSDGSVAAHI